MVVFLNFLQKLLFALFRLFLDLFAFFLSSGFLGLDLGCDFGHHFLVPLYFLVRILTTVLDETRLFDEVQIFLQQDVDFVVGQVTKLSYDLVDLLGELVEVFSGLTEKALKLRKVFAGGNLLTDFLLCGIVFFEVFERFFEKKVEPFSLEVHFFTNSTGIFFIAFFMVGDFT